MTYETPAVDAHLAREQMRKLFEEFEVAARKAAQTLPLDDQLSLSIPLEHFRRLLWPEYVRGGSMSRPARGWLRAVETEKKP